MAEELGFEPRLTFTIRLRVSNPTHYHSVNLPYIYYLCEYTQRVNMVLPDGFEPPTRSSSGSRSTD